MNRRNGIVIALLIGLSIAGGKLAMTSLAADAPKPMREKLLATFNEEFVEITPGKGRFPKSFLMGTERGPMWETPAHEVQFARSFQIGRYEVPQNLYEAVMGTNPSKWKGPRNSAENFTWSDASDFCQKATALLREAKLMGGDDEIRLPTEAEWEYCCRAGTQTPYSFGEIATLPGDVGHAASVLNDYGWHTGNAAGNDPAVGVLKPNPWGLYDMHGYLWEFVSDDWHETYAGAPADGHHSWAAAEGELPVRHVVRGGSWQERYECHRSAFRRPVEAAAKSDAIGFRCVKAKAAKD